MSFQQITSVTLMALIAGAMGFLVFSSYQTAQSSVIWGGEYYHTAVVTADAASTSSLRTLPGSIGQIIVENPSSGAVSLGFYATTANATSSADLILDFDAQAGEGTYTYDIQYGRGLLLDVPVGYTGDIVVTYR